LAALVPMVALLTAFGVAPRPAPPRGRGYSAVYPNVCMDNWQGSFDWYNPVVAYPCIGKDDSALWWFYDDSAWWSVIHPVDENGNVVWGMCLDVYAGGGMGSPVDLYRCNGTPAQTFRHYSDGKLYNDQSRVAWISQTGART
jgi:hypothetical protein